MPNVNQSTQTISDTTQNTAKAAPNNPAAPDATKAADSAKSAPIAISTLGTHTAISKSATAPHAAAIKTIILATRNPNKVREFQELMPECHIIPMQEVGFEDDIIESGETFEENATIKAEAIVDFLRTTQPDHQYIVVAEDSGLCVNALDGRPGVYTARYGGKGHSEHEQRLLLLEEMNGITDRRASFHCYLSCLLPAGHSIVCGGYTVGMITEEERGDNGFAFDQIFESIELGKTFAEATAAEKDSVSHRARAIEQLRISLRDIEL